MSRVVVVPLSVGTLRVTVDRKSTPTKKEPHPDRDISAMACGFAWDPTAMVRYLCRLEGVEDATLFDKKGQIVCTHKQAKAK